MSASLRQHAIVYAAGFLALLAGFFATVMYSSPAFASARRVLAIKSAVVLSWADCSWLCDSSLKKHLLRKERPDGRKPTPLF